MQIFAPGVIRLSRNPPMCVWLTGKTFLGPLPGGCGEVISPHKNRVKPKTQRPTTQEPKSSVGGIVFDGAYDGRGYGEASTNARAHNL